MPYQLPLLPHCVAIGLSLLSAASLSAQNFRPGRPPLPALQLSGAAQGDAAIQALGEKLPEVARHYGVSPEKLRELFQNDGELRTDRGGRLFFEDGLRPAGADHEHAPVAGGDGASAAALVPVDQTFLMHSRPVASRKIYLDFNGHVTSGTSWQNIYTGSNTGIYTPPYDFDGDTNGFSVAELERIQFIWQRVVEDFAPFDVDVTTEDPGLEGLRKTSSGDMSYGIRVCIGGASTDWYATAGYGGVAYLGSFDWNSDTPCFVFEANLGNGGEKYVAEAISHEAGHTLDLYHDGTSTQGYYSGHGTTDSWAPIMGVGYYKNVTQWSRGEYNGANNSEDDLTKLTASYNIPYLADDFGNTLAAAFPLPEVSFLVDGMIERNTDVDMFRFNAGAGLLDISVDVDSRSPNLNVQASLYDAGGTLLAVSNPLDSLGARLYLPGMPAGTYYVALDGVGAGAPATDGYSDYGSIGQYTLRGTVPSAGAPVAVAGATPASGMVPLVVQLSSAGSYDPDGGAVSFSWSAGGTSSTEPNPVLTYVTPGLHTITLTVTDDEGMTSVAVVQINALDVPPAAPSALSASAVSSSQINLLWSDNAGNETGFKIERSTDGINFTQIATVGANVTSFSNSGLSGGTSYHYRVRANNTSGDSAYSDPASATTPQALPAAPSKLTARAGSQTQINLTWLDNANNETGYYVERSATGASDWVRIATLSAGTKSFSNTGLIQNTRYYYRVQAYHGGGVSAYSNSASTTTKR